MTPPRSAFPALLQSFFQRRLVTERGASFHKTFGKAGAA